MTVSSQVLAGSLASSKQDEIHLGIISARGIDKTYKRYAPLAAYYSEKTGKTFRLVPLDHMKNLPYLRDGKIDFLLTNPTIAASVYKTTSTRLLATLHKTSGYQFGGVIIAKNGAGINTIQEMRNKRALAYKIRRSAGGHIFQSYHLLKQGVNDRKYFKWLRGAKTQDYVVRAVLNNHADVGFIRTGILELMAKEGKINIDDFIVIDEVTNSKFPQLHSTELYPEWYLIAGQEVNNSLVSEVKKLSLAISPDMDVARKINIKGFVEAQPIQPLINVLTTLKIPPFDQ